MSRTFILASAAAAATLACAPAMAAHAPKDTSPRAGYDMREGMRTGGRPDRGVADFIKKAVQGDRSEIMLSRIALKRSKNPEVRRFAGMLMNDHQQALQQAVQTAEQMGVRPPNGTLAKAQMERVKLDVLTGRSFDREFVRYMIRDHEQDIADYRVVQMRQHGPASRFAAQSLPVLRRHLDAGERIMGG